MVRNLRPPAVDKSNRFIRRLGHWLDSGSKAETGSRPRRGGFQIIPRGKIAGTFQRHELSSLDVRGDGSEFAVFGHEGDVTFAVAKRHERVYLAGRVDGDIGDCHSAWLEMQIHRIHRGK